MAINRFLQSSVQSGLPKFDSVWDGRSAVGSMEPISAITLTSSQSTVQFNSIPQTYTHLQLRVSAYGSLDLYDNYLTFNGVGGTSYVSHYLFGDGTSVGAGILTGPSGNAIGVGKTSSSPTSRGVSLIIDVLDYVNTNKNKTVKSLHGDDANGSGRILFQSGVFLSNNAITSLSLTPSSGTYSSSATFSLYGIK